MFGTHRGEIIHLTWRFAHAGRNLFCDTTENVIRRVLLRKAGSGYINRKPFGINEWNVWNACILLKKHYFEGIDRTCHQASKYVCEFARHIFF